MGTSIRSVLSTGSDGVLIEAECHISSGLPTIIIVGLGNKAIDEAKERVRSAFSESHMVMPKKRITINLAPADIPKESTSLDLAIAMAILTAAGQLKHQFQPNEAVIGELGLDGIIRPVRGVIGKLLIGKRMGITKFYIPEQNVGQAILIPDITIVPVKTLQQIYLALNGQLEIESKKSDASSKTMPPGTKPESNSPKLSEIVGQERAKRGLEIAAAGGHNVMLNGPPGTGKSMLAKSLTSILPHLNQEEMLEVTHLHSLSTNNYDRLVTERPFRAPHHSASHISVIGGGHTLRPGEISLSHRGVLFFDEFPEFDRRTIEALRQPLEDRTITVSRIKDSATYPANFIFIATANPCPCGYYGSMKNCHCTAHQIIHYRQKISGPIMDRIDLHVDVQAVEHDRLLQNSPNDTHDTAIAERVRQARNKQTERYGSDTKLNAHMTNHDIKTLSLISDGAKNILNDASKSLNISSRSYMKIAKIARTIADLEQAQTVETPHITEALQYRPQETDLLS